jgi:hypothetical protein
MIDLGYWRVTPDEETPVALDDDAQLFFPDYDMDADIAAEALGIGESRPIKMLKLFKFRPTDALLRIFPIEPKILCRIAVKWSEPNDMFEPPEDREFLEVYRDEDLGQWSKNFLDLARRTCTPPKTMGQIVLPGQLAQAKVRCEEIATWLRRAAASEGEEFMPEWMGEAMSAFHALLSLAEIVEDEEGVRFPLREEDAAKTLKDVFWLMYESETYRWGEDQADRCNEDRILTMAKMLVAAYR